MKQLDHLKEIADHNLGGLKADARLLHQIKLAANLQPERTINRRPVLIGSMAALTLLCVGLIVLPLFTKGQDGMDVVSRSAGSDLQPRTVQLTATIPAGSVIISESKEEVPGYRNLFAAEQNGNFPLVKVGSATYRMLASPSDLSSSQLGETLGEVTEYTLEPAISSSTIVSNAVSAMQPVYAVKNMKGAAVAANVQGNMRVFQRVSFGGTAIVGSEGLKDVLIGDAQVTAMELSDVGIVDQTDKVQELINILLRNAHYEGAAQSANSSQSLLLRLDNGIIVQMNAGSGTLSACGTWSCPEFFEAFAAAVAD